MHDHTLTLADCTGKAGSGVVHHLESQLPVWPFILYIVMEVGECIPCSLKSVTFSVPLALYVVMGVGESGSAF